MTEQDRLTLLTKRCAQCRHMKPWTEFTPRRRWPDGTIRTVDSWCRPCNRKRINAARAARPQHYRDLHNGYLARNREEFNRRARERHHEKREHDNAITRARYHSNPEVRARSQEKNRQYVAANREEINRRRRARYAAKRAEQGKPKVVHDEMPRLPLAPLREYLSRLLLVYEHNEIADMAGVSKRAIYRIFHETEEVQWDTADKLITKTGGVFALVYSDIYATGEEEPSGDLDPALQG